MSESLNNPPKPHKIAASAAPAPAKFSSWHDHFARERRWFAETFSAEKMIDMFKQLAWVVPLTLLIWIYAEREQIATLPNETIPFQLVSPDPNTTSVDLMPKQDSNVVVELQGPRARLQNVLQRLRGGTSLQGLRLEIDRNLAAGEHMLSTSQLVGNNPVFTQNGITVTRTQPERLHVSVDTIKEAEARVMPPPGVTTLDPATRFEPPTVKVKGPAKLLERAKNEAGGTLSVYARIPDDLLRTPGEKDSRKFSLELPQGLSQDDRVTLLRQDVEGTLRVRASDTTYEMPAMTVSLDQPKSVSDKYVVDYTTSLPSVTLIGPKDKIDQVSDPNYQQKPYAQLRVTSADVAKEGLRRRLRFVDLPSGVRVSEKDEQREIPFTVKPKSDADQ